jgi:hypothetical protein
MAIVGGTGSYASVTGTVKLVPVGQTTQRLEITFDN